MIHAILAAFIILNKELKIVKTIIVQKNIEEIIMKIYNKKILYLVFLVGVFSLCFGCNKDKESNDIGKIGEKQETFNYIFRRGYKTELEEWDGAENVHWIEESRELDAFAAKKVIDEASAALDIYNDSEKSIIEIKKDLIKLLHKYEDNIEWVKNGSTGPCIYTNKENDKPEVMSYLDYKCDFPMYQIYRLQLDNIIEDLIGKEKYLKITERDSNETNYILKDKIIDISYFPKHIRIATKINGNRIFTTNIDELYSVGGQLLERNIKENDYRKKNSNDYSDKEHYYEYRVYDYEFLNENNIRRRKAENIEKDLFKRFDYTWMIVEYSVGTMLRYKSRETDDWHKGPAISKTLFDLKFYDVEDDNKYNKKEMYNLMIKLKDLLNERFNRNCWYFINDDVYGYTLINLLLINKVDRTKDGDIRVKFLLESKYGKEIFWYHKYDKELYDFLKKHEHYNVDIIANKQLYND